MAEPLRILYVVSQWQTPTQTFVRREVDAARAAGNAIVVLSLKPPPQVVDGDPIVIHLDRRTVARDALLTVVRHPIRTGSALLRAVSSSRAQTVRANVGALLIGLAATRRIPAVDWVHAHFAWIAASAADGFVSVRKQPYSVFPHAHDIFDDTYVDRYTGVKLRRAAFVVVESAAIQREVNERFACRAGVARMGVPPSYLADQPDGRPVTSGLVVSVGSLLPKKGHDVLIRAIARLPTATRLAIAGTGEGRGDLERLVRELGVDDRVEWLGSVPEAEIPSLLDSAAVFCLASRRTDSGDRDGVPNVLIEAMARGVPCLSTAVSGIPDLLGNGRGVVVEPDDVDALASALSALLANSDFAHATAKLGHQHVAEAYTTDRNWTLIEARMRAARRGRQGPHDSNRLSPSIVEHSYLQLRSLAMALRAEAVDVPDGLIVDLGCGAKPYAELFDGTYVGVDLQSTHGTPDCVAWAERLPVRGHAAGVVISTQQLEHVDDPMAVLAEARRVLQPGGRLLLSTHGVWPYHPDPHDYWRWTEEGLTKLVAAAGFDVLRVHRQGGAATAALGLILYPLGAVRQRHAVAAPVASVLIALGNVLAAGFDRLGGRVTSRLAAASYLVVATARHP